MKIIKLDSQVDCDLILKKIGSTKAGIKIMRDKMQTNLFYLKDIKTPAANILKQDALSIGADLAVEKDTILYKDETIDALLIATDKQIKILSRKELAQPFGLKGLAMELKRYANVNKYKTEIMGILNANEDSFYEGSRFSGLSAVSRIEQMIEEGADIVDIGAVSSRPGSDAVDAKEELERITPIIDAIYKQKLHDRVVLSLDSYQPLVIEYALDRGFKIVNDITGLSDDKVAKLVAMYEARVVIMHMQGSPQDMQKNPLYENVLLEVEAFFKQKVQKAHDFGIKDIVLDIGVGFGKTLSHNLQLIKHLSHFKKLEFPLLVGASRKSMIDAISPSSADERLAGTLALHLKALDEGASIIRCHDVKEHKQAFEVREKLRETLI
ncbi:MAG TPA: dihydropteroate synthase [Campylobacterales bacterium]|nr:dihydropteroate synthase [Campylobacterales bacterium]